MSKSALDRLESSLADLGAIVQRHGPMLDRLTCEVQERAVREAQERRRDVLHLSLPPRGLSRVEAAAYIGISPGLFDQIVADGRMPKPKRINSRKVWDRLMVDEAFTGLPDERDERENQSLGPSAINRLSPRWWVFGWVLMSKEAEVQTGPRFVKP